MTLGSSCLVWHCLTAALLSRVARIEGGQTSSCRKSGSSQMYNCLVCLISRVLHIIIVLLPNIIFIQLELLGCSLLLQVIFLAIRLDKVVQWKWAVSYVDYHYTAMQISGHLTIIGTLYYNWDGSVYIQMYYQSLSLSSVSIHSYLPTTVGLLDLCMYIYWIPHLTSYSSITNSLTSRATR